MAGEEHAWENNRMPIGRDGAIVRVVSIVVSNRADW